MREKYNFFWKKKMLSLTKEELKWHQDAKVCYICDKWIFRKLFKSINYQDVRDHCHYLGKNGRTAYNICNLNLMCPMKSLWFFITAEAIIIFFSQTNDKPLKHSLSDINHILNF